MSDARPLPNFLVIGAEKAGTSWFYERLRPHPEIFLPGVKELHYFNSRTSNLELNDHYTALGPEWYARHFRGAEGRKAIGEVTPMYVCDADAPARIRETLGTTRLICCLRNPVDRAYSHFWMARRKQHVEAEFADLARTRDERFIQRGLYGAQLERVVRALPESPLLVLVFEEVFADPTAALAQVCDFLGVGPLPDPQASVAERVHEAGEFRSAAFYGTTTRVARWMRRSPVLSAALDALKGTGIVSAVKAANRRAASYPKLAESVRRELLDWYAPDIAKLEAMLGRRLDLWSRIADPVPPRGLAE